MKKLILSGLVAIGLVTLVCALSVNGPDLMMHYYSSSSGSPTYEGAVQVYTNSCRVFSLYAASSSGSIVYLKVQDSSNAGTDNGPCIYVIPIAANSFASIGGAPQTKACTNGIYLAPFSDAACTIGAGNVLFYSVDYE